ncbi:MAG: SCP2 sterol-binding domain-containing protein [Porticoccaceae bacterium]|nr:SCP2 sterol-binding domain-containing protein [Porticoccaceae bacterium]|tara:strand:+ start:370 stop:1020 length:651 start_codon:yes stop_codon:yes gene_type:complete
MLAVMQKTALEGVEHLINRALEYDPVSAKALTHLDGQIIRIDSTMPPISISISIETVGQGVKLHSERQEDSDVTIEGTLVSMVSVALSSKESMSFSGTGVKVSGNLDTLNQLNKIIGNLDIDWEGALAQIIGDLPAHLFAKTVRNSAAFKTQTTARASSAIVEVAQEEFQLTPSKNEFETIGPQIRRLSSDVDRLTAKVKKFQVKVNQHISEKVAS